MSRIATTLAVTGLILAPSLAAAQGNSEYARQQARCRLAAQIVSTGHPAPHESWALPFIPTCGAVGADGLAAGFRALRTDTDTAALAALALRTLNFRDATLFEAELDIAGDRSASVPARVFAFRSLTSLLHPDRHITYADMVGLLTLPDPPGYSTASCARGSKVMDYSHPEGAPLPTDFVEQIRAVGVRVWQDRSEPTEVRSAAACVS